MSVTRLPPELAGELFFKANLDTMVYNVMNPQIAIELLDRAWVMLQSNQISFSYNYIDKAKEDSGFFLKMQPDEITPHDGYQYMDDELSYTFTPDPRLTITERTQGFTPGDQFTHIARRKYTLTHPGRDTLVLLHYSKADMSRAVVVDARRAKTPARQYPLKPIPAMGIVPPGPQPSQIAFRPGYPPQQQLPKMAAPYGASPVAGSPVSPQQPAGYNRFVNNPAHAPGPAVQQHPAQQGPQRLASINAGAYGTQRHEKKSSHKKHHPQGHPHHQQPQLTPQQQAQVMAQQQAQAQEDAEEPSGDELDFLTARDVAIARYKRNHDYIDEVFSPYPISTIMPPRSDYEVSVQFLNNLRDTQDQEGFDRMKENHEEKIKRFKAEAAVFYKGLEELKQATTVQEVFAANERVEGFKDMTVQPYMTLRQVELPKDETIRTPELKPSKPSKPETTAQEHDQEPIQTLIQESIPESIQAPIQAPTQAPTQEPIQAPAVTSTHTEALEQAQAQVPASAPPATTAEISDNAMQVDSDTSVALGSVNNMLLNLVAGGIANAAPIAAESPVLNGGVVAEAESTPLAAEPALEEAPVLSDSMEVDLMEAITEPAKEGAMLVDEDVEMTQSHAAPEEASLVDTIAVSNTETPALEAPAPTVTMPEVVSEANASDMVVEEAPEHQPESLQQKEQTMVEHPVEHPIEHPVEQTHQHQEQGLRSSEQSEVTPQQPDEVSQQPEIAPQEPVVPQQPEVTLQQSEETLQQPEAIPQQPEVVPQQPEVVSQQPEIVSQEPEVVRQEPEVAPQKPEAIPQEPEVVQQQSEVASHQLEPSRQQSEPSQALLESQQQQQQPSEQSQQQPLEQSQQSVEVAQQPIEPVQPEQLEQPETHSLEPTSQPLELAVPLELAPQQPELAQQQPESLENPAESQQHSESDNTAALAPESSLPPHIAENYTS